MLRFQIVCILKCFISSATIWSLTTLFLHQQMFFSLSEVASFTQSYISRNSVGLSGGVRNKMF